LRVLTDLPYVIADKVRLRSVRPIVPRVNALEGELMKRSDAELRQSAAELRRRLSMGETLEDVEPEAFALVRESARRNLTQRHFDVQVLGAAAMHRGWIAEMQTGEGKTLTATMPAFLNALSGRGVHVVTVNDFLASRDAEWMGNVYRALGLTVGCLVHGITDQERIDAYQADITYGTNKEFAFDYLRDQLRLHASRQGAMGGVLERHAAARPAGQVQRGHHYAIVDEVDSILIDEARVPLIISDKEGEESPWAAAYHAAREAAGQLREGADYTVDLAQRRVELTRRGIAGARQMAVPAPPRRPFEHLVEQALRAERLYERDREYLLMDDKVCIVDEFTGRVMPDRSWSLGMHQAIEAKEGVPITEENRTLASVTFQRYFKLYGKLSGMTGTAAEARREFRKIFDLPVASIPTNRPMRRRHLPTQAFTTWDRKFEAVGERILSLHEQQRPVLVGTRSVGRSEQLSAFLTEHGIEHSVLNARNHEAEAAIIAQAGQPGRVTIATNMAGRGVDILLGRNVAGLGGLHVLGTEMHEAGRIDRQLGGRAGRQGDPGSYEFFVCLEDEILERWSKFLARRLRARARRKGAGRPRARLGRLYLPLFHLAQRTIERRHLRIRLDLVEHDKHLEEMKGSLGVPAWG
jgi:preprotein translocase subunit SecA